MEKLITNCLENIELNKLFNLKFAYLLDMIGPSNDGFLGENSIFSNATSAKELIRSKNNNIKNIEIMTGTNSLEGFIFHAVFSKSVKYWTQNHLSFQIILTLERFSLFFRDKCKQKKIIEHRLKLDQFYDEKLKKIVKEEKFLLLEEVQRFKQIFLISDLLFDAGFAEFINSVPNTHKLYVYEYLHENTANLFNLKSYKKYLNDEFELSTHFNSIDMAFGNYFHY
jgi:hypothetical protein